MDQSGPLRLAQTVTQRSSEDRAGRIEIEAATYTDGELVVDLVIDPSEIDWWRGEPDGVSFHVAMFDRTRGQKLTEDFNVETDIGRDQTNMTYGSFNWQISAPVPDGTEVELVFRQTLTLTGISRDGSVNIITDDFEVSAFVEVGEPGSDPDIVAQVSDPDTGTTMIVWRAVKDGEGGLVEVELQGGETPLPQAGDDSFLRVVSGVDVDDVVARQTVDAPAPGGSTTTELSFRREGFDDTAVVSFVHPDITGDIMATVDLTAGDIQVPISQLEVTDITARQLGQERIIQADFEVSNTTVSGDGERQMGVIQFYFEVDPDTSRDPGTERTVLKELSVDLAAGGSVTDQVTIEDDSLPAGEYDFCARIV